MVRGRRKRKVPGRDSGRKIDGREPRRGQVEARLGRMACDWRAHAEAIRADGRVGKRGRARVGLRGRRSAVAFEL